MGAGVRPTFSGPQGQMLGETFGGMAAPIRWQPPVALRPALPPPQLAVAHLSQRRVLRRPDTTGVVFRQWVNPDVIFNV